MNARAMGGRRVAVVGAGYSDIGRRLGKSPRYLTSVASRRALEDAGLKPADVDGIVAYTAVNHAAARPIQLSAQDMGFVLGVPSLRWFEGATGPAFGAAFLSGVAAVASGSTEVCLVLRTILKEGATPAMTPPAEAYGGDSQFVAPFGGFISANWGALLWQRHNALYGTGELDTGAQALAQREFALLNEQALMRSPLTIEDYLAARFISKPIRLLDCDYPVDAGAAVVIASEERARDCRTVPIFVDSWAFGSPAVPDFYLLDDLDNSAPNVAARALWDHTDLRPDDVDVCGLYDGQIPHTLLWLEALGLCEKGQSGEFVRAGHTRLGGKLPTNCDGGAVNVGRVHGANHFIEVIRQLRGESGARQTPGARVGVSANAIGMMAATAIMVRD